MPHALPVADIVATVSSTRIGSRPTMTALPPEAITSAAVCRPIPLLPPMTISLRPSKLEVMTSSIPSARRCSENCWVENCWVENCWVENCCWWRCAEPDSAARHRAWRALHLLPGHAGGCGAQPAGKEVADQRRDLVAGALEQEVAAVEQVDLRVDSVDGECLGAFGCEDFVAAAPDSQHGHSARAQVLVQPRVERWVAGVV